MDSLIDILSKEIENVIIVEDNELLKESATIDVTYLLKNSSVGLTNVRDVIKRLKLLPTTNSVSIINGEFTEDGLFSEKIYGLLGSPERKTKLSFIDLSPIGEFLHPVVIYYFSRYTTNLFSAIISTKDNIFYTYDESKKILVETKDYTETSMSGYHLVKFIVDNYKKINNLPTKLVDIIKRYGEDILTEYILIIPPDLRPVHKVNNMLVVDKINDIYSSLIQYVLQYKYLDKKDLLWNTVWKNIQAKILQLYETIVENIHKKEGLIRNKVLSKRVDFNVASTVINDPTLSVWEIGIPYILAASLGYYHIIYVLMNKDSRKRDRSFLSLIGRYGIRTYDQIALMIKEFERKNIFEDELVDIIKEAIDIAFENKYVLYKRDPALHRDSWTVAKPVLVDDTYAIKLSASAAKPLNLDYDGDSISGDSIVKIYDSDGNIIFNDMIEKLVPVIRFAEEELYDEY